MVQLDDFDAYFKDMSKDSAYKFSLQFEVSEAACPTVLGWHCSGSFIICGLDLSGAEERRDGSFP